MNNLTIGKYLIESLRKIGLNDVFGIPGDYALSFFNLMEEEGVNIVGTCSEQGAAFAADAYSRMNGIGALCVTYCVGGLNTINAVAGAYAEKAPLIVISGAPGVSECNSGYLLHHSIRDLDSQFNIFKEVTVASTQLKDPYTAPSEIDRVIKTCLAHKRPVYIELPRDMVHQKCSYPIREIDLAIYKDLSATKEAIEEAVEIIKNSIKPVIIAGVEIRRYKLEEKFLDLLESTGFPYATTSLGKCVIEESHPQFIGTYMGKLGLEKVRNYIEEADSVIILGALMTDTNLGTAQLDVSKTIYATAYNLRIKNHCYRNVDLGDFIEGLAGELRNSRRPLIDTSEVVDKEAFEVAPDNPITVNRFFKRLNRFIRPNDAIICDIGDSLFGSVNLKLPRNTIYLGPAFYTSMGYAVPAAIGVQIGNPDLRTIVIVGDGAFQMTGHEVSCCVKYGLKPIIFILNNKGYTTQRYLKEGSFNDINNWSYHLITKLVGGGLGLEVKTEEELELAIEKADKNTDSFTIINMHTDKHDKSETLHRLTSIFSTKLGCS
ncbi:MAG: hypothetical protein A2287_09250 [Candidatus Melainabacteria bacterium RIFOXYA12_FULL_32_12]|nr:MAG: hypothetical protein A2287_09250 [Candidatus Melainabacteria bacterium RIFOXYA12_FULL_32_12]